MALERLLDDAALDAATATVDEPQLGEPGFVSRADVLFDDGRDVARRERMQVELRFDGDGVRFAVHRSPFAVPGYAATTVVVMPPRAVKAPVTVIVRGRQAATRSSRIWFVSVS